MAKGKFKLYYTNDAGQKIACDQVQYRILGANRHEIIKGVTDSLGETGYVRSPDEKNNFTSPSTTNNAPPFLPGLTPAEKYADHLVLEVFNSGKQAWQEPELPPNPNEQPTMTLPAGKLGMAFTHPVRLRPFQQARLITKGTQVGIVKAKFVAMIVDRDGKTVRARDDLDKVILGNTDTKGFTGRVYSTEKFKFKFTLPGSNIDQISALLEPKVTGMRGVYEEVQVKGQLATTSPAAGNAAHVAGKNSLPVIVNPQADELIIVPPKLWAEFEAMSGHVEGVMVTMHQAKLDLSHALESKDEKSIATAEKNLGLAEDKVKSMLNKDFKKLADMQEVITFETYNKGKSEGNAMGVRRRYIPKAKYEELRKKTYKGIPYKVDFKAKPGVKVTGPSALGAQSSGAIKSKDMDYSKLVESFKKITTSIKAEKDFGSAMAVYDMTPAKIAGLEIAGGELANTIKHGDWFEVDSAAQWMRFVGSAGLNGELNIDPRKGIVKGKIQGNLQAKAIAFEGKSTARVAIPSLNGWMMRNEAIDLGAIRFVLECEIYGFAGAKGTLSGSLGVCIDKNKVTRSTKVSGDLAKGGKQPVFAPAGLNEKPPEDINGLQLTAEVFVGVEGGLKPKGSLQWLPPQAKDFSAFAEIGVDLAASAGAGASAQLSIFYANGQFRIKASARLCWGIGAKGAVDFMVSVEKMLEFTKWVYHQLMNSGFKVLIYLEKEAFKSLSAILFSVIAQDSDVGKLLVSRTQGILVALDDQLKQFDLAKTRNEMVLKINRVPPWLVYATPETRGMLMYQIIRHSKFTHARDWPTTTLDGFDPEVHYLPSHKEAILNIMRTVRTCAEWDNVMQHTSPKGTKSSQSAGKNEGDVLRLLNSGMSLNGDLPSVFSGLNKNASLPEELNNSYIEKYVKLRKALLNQFPKGYEIVMNGSREFEYLASKDGDVHPDFGTSALAMDWHGDDDLLNDSQTRTA